MKHIKLFKESKSDDVDLGYEEISLLSWSNEELLKAPFSNKEIDVYSILKIYF